MRGFSSAFFAFSSVASAAFLAAGCVVGDASAAGPTGGDDTTATTAPTEAAAPAAGSGASDFTRPSRDLWVATRDPRTCAPPACGGWYVQTLGQQVPKYVTDLDLAKTGLSADLQASLTATMAANSDPERATIVLRGALVESSAGLPYNALRVFAVWQGDAIPATSNPRGAWYTFADEDPELVAREVGYANEYAVRVSPPTPEGVLATDTIVRGFRDEDLLDVEYRVIRVR